MGLVLFYRDEWHGYVPSYNPRFYNGYQPSPQLVEDVNQPSRDEPIRTSVSNCAKNLFWQGEFNENIQND